MMPPVKPLGALILSFMHKLNWLAMTGLGFVAGMIFTNSTAAALLVVSANQTGVVPFTPTWTLAPGSLIAGVAPSSAVGNFSLEPQAGSRKVDSLTAGGSLTIYSVGGASSTCSTNYVTCGNGYGAGASVIYNLPAAANGYNLTNLTVYGGWQDSGAGRAGL